VSVVLSPASLGKEGAFRKEDGVGVSRLPQIQVVSSCLHHLARRPSRTRVDASRRLLGLALRVGCAIRLVKEGQGRSRKTLSQYLLDLPYRCGSRLAVVQSPVHPSGPQPSASRLPLGTPTPPCASQCSVQVRDRFGCWGQGHKIVGGTPAFSRLFGCCIFRETSALVVNVAPHCREG